MIEKKKLLSVESLISETEIPKQTGAGQHVGGLPAFN